MAYATAATSYLPYHDQGGTFSEAHLPYNTSEHHVHRSSALASSSNESLINAAYSANYLTNLHEGWTPHRPYLSTANTNGHKASLWDETAEGDGSTLA